jgi:hypothetical protein
LADKVQLAFFGHELFRAFLGNIIVLIDS